MIDAPRPATSTNPLQQGLVVGGRYRLGGFVARGGMAEVWEATDEILGRPVAVKVLLPHLAVDPAFLERFRREAVAAARLAHPNVVATYDTGVDGELAFIVMELVTGTTLRAVLAERGGLAPPEAVGIAVQVLDALDYAHRCGIVHRDIKPANVLIGTDGRVKVADFGIAKAAGGNDSGRDDDATGLDLTGTGAVIGTAKYLSPEQIEGHPVDARSDVYSLGVLLYEMICGRPPFVGTTDMAVGVQHLSRDPVSPRQVRAGIPRPLEVVVLQAMAKPPDQRPPSAAAMRAALGRIDLRPDDAVPMAAPDDTPPAGTVLGSFARPQRRWLIPAVGVLVVALALGIGAVLVGGSGSRGERQGGATTGGDVAVVAVAAFDPAGDGREHDEETGFLLDGDPASTWSTSNYANPAFGGLKPGVGLVLTLDRATVLHNLEVDSPTRGWTAEVAAVDGPIPSDRAGWGDPVATGRSGGGTTEFDLDGRRATAVLLWFTHLGDGNGSISVSDLRVT